MPFIRQVADDEAEGLLARLYQSALKRAGKIFNVIRIQGLNPEVLKASTQLYSAAMFGTSPLSRAERELAAVVVSQANDCHY